MSLVSREQGEEADLLPGIEDGQFVLAFFDADELTGDAAAAEDAIALVADVADRGDLAEDGVEVEELAVGGAVEAFDLALGLRMIRPAVEGVDAQADQAGVQPAQADVAAVVDAAVSPEGVVGEDGLGEADLSEELPEDAPDGGMGQVQAGGVKGRQ